MARIETDPFYTTPTFSRATAATDLVELEDFQTHAAAFSTHDHTPGKGALIGAGGIAAGSITSAMIQDGAITSADIGAGQILATNIGDQQVSAAKIAPGAVGQGQLADGAVITQKIADGQVTSAKLAPNIAISGTLSVGGATTLSTLAVSGAATMATSLTFSPGGLIRMGPAAAQQTGGVNLSNSMPMSWRNAANSADVSMIIDNANHLSLVGWADDGGTFTPAGAAPNALRIIINGAAWRAPLYPMP